MSKADKKKLGYVELKRIEKWDGKLPTMVLGGNGGMMMNLPAAKEQQ